MKNFLKKLSKSTDEAQKVPSDPPSGDQDPQTGGGMPMEEAQKPAGKRPTKGAPQDELAAKLQNRRRLPTGKEKDFFDAQRVSGRNQKVAKLLEGSGLINQEMISEALRSAQGEAAAPLEKAIVQQGFISETDVLDAIAAELNMEVISLNDINVTPDLIEQVDKKIARDYKVFPVAYTDNEISIAISDPLNINVMDDLERILRKKIVPMVANEEEIDRFYKRFYEGSEIESLYENVTDTLHQKEQDAMEAQEIVIDEEQRDVAPHIKFVDLIFKQAVHDRASDIHIEPTRRGITIRFRVDGVLHEVPSPPKKWQNAIISRLKVLSGMDLAEKRIPQDGRIKLTLPDRKLDLRVNSLPTIHGESIVMRILDQSSVILGLEDVGFLPDNIQIFNNLIRSPNGVILMTGPTGSGKTTTLYSALSTINTPEIKIITVENPVEYMLEGVNQVQIDEAIELDFKTALRSILRQSPDVLLVGEMRDLETAEIGIRAALTGHLVFSTLHTNDAATAPTRLIDMGVKPFLVASSLQAAIAQRLIRRLCSHCKKAHSPSEKELVEVGASQDEIHSPDALDLYGPVGCDRCSGNGYRGRTAIHEILTVDGRIRQMIIRGDSSIRIKKVAVRQGMNTLRMDGWTKAKLGQTTVSEVFRITQDD